ncbi:hypothetical protein LCGC14_1434870 [marine sediment metagenome]|uniref:Uncharacterized protein n=1 Tax=marine sediment metagenome TaxID=412755 RepID=A0A0F9K8P3_9ZZZZ
MTESVGNRMTVNDVADTLVGFAHETWKQQVSDLVRLSQSSGLNIPSVLLVFEFELEDCTPEVLCALWVVREEFGDHYYWRWDVEGARSAPWQRQLYEKLSERYAEDVAAYLPGGMRYAEIHRESLRTVAIGRRIREVL